MENKEIMLKPVISEKSYALANEENKYVFFVGRDVNKIEIKKAIEKIFSVKVLDVNTIRMLGKPKSLGKYNGKRPDWKKAVVTLREGDKIADFEV